jgi:hypothetical protein
MKLTRNRLKELILEVQQEQQSSMFLTEATFNSAKRKIDEEMQTFAVFSSSRGERSARQNKKVDDKVRSYLKSSGFPYTVVEGGYKETPRDEAGEEIEGSETTSEIEKSYLIFDQDSRPDVEKTEKLFNVVNEACKISDQESFSYGYARTVSDEHEGEKREMFIAIYPTGAIAPGDSNRIKESWAGPWTSFADMQGDSGYYTKIRNSKGTFKEEIESLRESLKHTNSKIEKRRIHHKIQILQRLVR